MLFEIKFSGHQNIRSLHKRTIEITTESHLTPAGDCIIGVNATCGCKDLPESLKEKLRDPATDITFSIIVDNDSFTFRGKGHNDLVLEHPHDIVVRKSSYICPRTLAIQCDMASDLIPRKMIQKLQNPNAQGRFVIQVD